MSVRRNVIISALLLSAAVVSPTIFAAVPVVSNGLPATSFAGEQFCFTSRFTNADADKAGFGPYIRVDFPDGISFDSATILGTNPEVVNVGVFSEPSNMLVDPRSETEVVSMHRNALGLIILPIGSVVSNGPNLTTEICATFDEDITVGSPLTVGLTGVFEYGDSANGDIATEGVKVEAQITPTLYELSSDNASDGGKTVPGQSNALSLSTVVDIANAQTVNNLEILHVLDQSLTYLAGSVGVTGGTGQTINNEPNTNAGGTVNVAVDSAIGSTSSSDVDVSLLAYVPDLLDGGVCDSITINNSSSLDAQNSAFTSQPQLNSATTYGVTHLAIRQNVSAPKLSPGDTAQVTSVIQVTDYYSANSISITEVINDGLTYVGNDSILVDGVAVEDVAIEVTDLGNGVTQIVYNVTDATSQPVQAAGTVVLTYDVLVDDQYASGSPVLARDNIGLSSKLDFGLSSGATACSDASSSSIVIDQVSSRLDIVDMAVQYQPDDVVSYVFEMVIPSGDTSGITFDVFFPLPVFDVTLIDATIGGDINYRPNDTGALTPTFISINEQANKLSIGWPDISSDTEEVISVQVDVKVVDEPFQDNLFLTTLFLADTKDSDGDGALQTNPNQIIVRAPLLDIAHGLISASGDGEVVGVSPNQTLQGADAGDRVTFQAVIRNLGGADAHEVIVKAENTAHLTNVNIDSVKFGTSSDVNYNGDATDFVNDGISLIDIIEASDGSPNSSYWTDTVIVTYSADIASSIETSQSYLSNAVVDWTSSNNAARFDEVSNETEVIAADGQLVTEVITINPGDNGQNVVVGDTVTYRATVTLPEGVTPDLAIDFELPAGLEYLSDSIVVDTTGFSGTVDTSPTLSLSGSVTSGQDLNVVFDSPAETLVLVDGSESSNEFSVQIEALVTDSSSLDGYPSLQSINVNSELGYANFIESIESAASTNFSEHNLSVTSSFSQTSTLSAGDVVEVTVTIENDGTAPAYDITVSDVVNTDLFDIDSVSLVTTALGYSANVSLSAVSYTSDTGVSLGVNESKIFVYSVVVKDDVVSGSSYQNSSTVVGDSLDGVQQEERSQSDSASATASVTSLSISDLSIVDTSESWSSTSPMLAAIGEVLTYKLVVAVPEAQHNDTTNNDFIEIQLPNGTEYVAGTAIITTTNVATSIDTANFDSGAALPNSDTSITPNYDNGVLGFDLGTIINNDNDADVETIEISYDVLVANVDSNNQSDSKVQSAFVYFNNNASAPQSVTDTDTFIIGEANITVSKTATPASVSGGELVTFSIEVSNTDGAASLRAWELDITDELPEELENIQLVSANLTRNDSDLSSCVAVSGQTLTLEMSCLPPSQQYLGTSETISIEYTANVTTDIGFEETVINPTTVTYTSLPGDFGTSNAISGQPGTSFGERTGSDNNSPEDAVNDLIEMASAAVVSGKPTVLLEATDTNLHIGEHTTISASIGIPNGTTDEFVVTYQLPKGLNYNGEAVVITEPLTGFSSTLVPQTSFDGTNTSLVFDFGSITNASTTGQSLTFDIGVKVDNIVENQHGTMLSSNMTLNYANASQPYPTSTSIITLVEPTVELTKSIVAGATGSDAGDSITYKMVLTNTSNSGTAYHIDLNEVVPTELLGGSDGDGTLPTFSNLSLTNTDSLAVFNGTSDVVSVDDLTIATSDVANDTLTLPTFDLLPGGAVTIIFDLTVANSASAGDQIVTNAVANFNSLVDGSGRDSSDIDTDGINDYQASATQSLSLLSSIAVQQSLSDVHDDSNFAIGELVTFDVRVDLVEGVTESLSIVNSLAEGLSYVSSNFVAGGHISYDGELTPIESTSDTLTINLGNVTNISDEFDNNNFAVVQITAQVDSITDNVAGTILTNSVSVSSATASAGPSAQAINVVEPNLQVTIEPSHNASSVGDTVTFDVLLQHDMSTADAFDTKLTIMLPDGMTYKSDTYAGDGVVSDIMAGGFDVDLSSITVIDGSKSFSFDVTIDADVTNNSILTTSITNGQYSSVGGEATVKRQYAFSDQAQVSVNLNQTVSATHYSEVIVDNGLEGQLDGGDIIQYTITISNLGGDIDDLTYVESIPNFSTYVEGSMSSTAPVSIIDGRIVVDETTLLSNQDVVITYAVAVNNDAPDGATIRAQGVVDASGTTPILTDADAFTNNGAQASQSVISGGANPVEPLYVQQFVEWIADNDNDGFVSPGDEMQVSFLIINDALMPLNNVVVEDSLPLGVTYNSDSGVSLSNSTITVIDGVMLVTVPELASGERVFANYTIIIDSPMVDLNRGESEEVFSHVGSAYSDQSEPIPTDGNTTSDDGYQPVTYTVVSNALGSPQLENGLQWTLVNDADNDGNVSPGDTVLYEYRIQNIGAAPATNVVLSDSLQAETGLVAGSPFTSQGAVTVDSLSEIDVNIGNIEPGQTVTAGYLVVIDDALTQQTIIENNATVLADNTVDGSNGATRILSSENHPVLIPVSPNTTEMSFAPTVTTSVTSTSDTSTEGNDIVQSERATLEMTLVLPPGVTEDTVIRLSLPQGVSLSPNSVFLSRVFESGLTLSTNLANINEAESHALVDISQDVDRVGAVNEITLGTIINSDNDSNAEQIKITLELLSLDTLPTIHSEELAVGVTLSYTNAANLVVEGNNVGPTLTLLNRLPTVVADTIEGVLEDSEGTVIDVLGNDSDSDVGHLLLVASVSETEAGGNVQIIDNKIVYTPVLNFNGTDTFTYSVVDSAGGSASTTVNIDVVAVNDNPSATVDNAMIDEDVLSMFVPLANDTDLDGDALQIASASANVGNVTIENNQLVYTPVNNYVGDAVIEYCVVDGNGGTACSLVNVSIANVNDTPVANDDVVDVLEDTATIIDLLANDIDIDSDVLTISEVVAQQGTVTTLPNGTVSYLPPADFIGEETVSYCVIDPSGAKSCAVVTINVQPVNDAPLAIADLVTVDEDTSVVVDVLNNDIDVDGDQLTIINADAAVGTVEIVNNKLVYQGADNFNGLETILYCITDTALVESCNTVTINVVAVNDAPQALDDVAVILVDEPVVLMVLNNDIDLDDDNTNQNLMVTEVLVDSGMATVNNDGSIAYVPALGFFGEVSLDYTIIDGDTVDALTDIGTVTIIVEEPPTESIELPLAAVDVFTTSDWLPVQLDVLANDIDPQGEALTLLSVSSNAGTVEIVDGQVVFTPITGYSGSAEIEYVVVNENGMAVTGIAIVEVEASANAVASYPQLTIPADLCGSSSVSANALYTRVDVGNASAVDQFGNPLPVSIVNGSLLFPPGINVVLWQATDSNGLTTTKPQNVCVSPLVSIEKDKVVAEGSQVEVGVYLNGPSEAYPLVVGYTISGTVDSTDYVVDSGTVVFEEGTEQVISLDILNDNTQEQDETLVITLETGLNRGAQFEHVLTVTEGNVAPEISFDVTQSNINRLTVTRGGGNVVITSNVYDPNEFDILEFEWSSELINISGAQSKFIFDPTALPLGVYKVDLMVSDNGLPIGIDRDSIYVNVVDALAILSTADSDGDLIPDNVEGFQDADRDGIPDYLDRVMECNVLLQESMVQNQYLVEGDPGVCIRRGELTFIQEGSSGALLSEAGTEIATIEADTVADNVGGIMDFIAYGLQDSDEPYRIAMPLRKPIPGNAVYRKYRSEQGWGYFVENDQNSLSSTAGEPGYCPPTGSNLWTPGLTAGHWCVQLKITDGGPNDDDGIANGTIVDPGYVGVIKSSNRAPVATNDALTMPFNTTVFIDVLANDSDADSDVLSIDTVTANFGTATIVNDTIEYQAPADFVGTVIINYGISDPNGATDAGVVTVEIVPNTPPEPKTDNAQLTQGESSVINVLDNDTDADGDLLTVVSAIANNGSVEVTTEGQLIYVPNADFYGEDTITYVVSDAYGAQQVAMVFVTVIQKFEPINRTTSSGGNMHPLLLLSILGLLAIRRRAMIQSI